MTNATVERPVDDVVIDAATLELVRPAVRGVLEASPSFRALSVDDQRRIARDMVKIGAALASPGAAIGAGGDLARPFVGGRGVENLKNQLGQDPGFAGGDFEAGALRAGTAGFKELVQAVDFPSFVSGLVRGTFQAIVDSSIKQMEAYGELLANVAKSVDQFARDNITENNARDWLVGQFPDTLELGESQGSFGLAEGETPETPTGAVVTVKEDAPDNGFDRIREALQLTRDFDFGDEASEAELVRRARLEIARGRQQLLSSMVMLGINRIVVTDGLINAKVIFDMKARDVAHRGRTASMYDRESTMARSKMSTSYGAWFSPVKAGFEAEARQDHVTTVQTAVDEQSDSAAELKAKLSGEVRVNFKSDYFPLEKLASVEMIQAIQGNAEPPARRLEGT